MFRCPRVLLPLALLAGLAGCEPPDAGRTDPLPAAYLRLVEAEDARPAGGAHLDLLLGATTSTSPVMRAVAVRGLGRLEDPDHLPALAPLLRDTDPLVRREAANALAQAVHGTDGSAALAPLLRAAREETDPGVLGIVARSLGRLHLPAHGRRAVASALVVLSRGADGFAPPYQMEGVALGMASFIRGLGGDAPPTVLDARLEEMTRYGVEAPAWDEGAARVRAAAVAAYGARGLAPAHVERLLGDPSPTVRRVAASLLGTLDDVHRTRLVHRAMEDTAPPVRLEAMRRGLAAPPRTEGACARLLVTAASDPDAHVRVAALDALGQPCPDRATQATYLATAAAGLAQATGDWHAPAHALASLAVVDPGRAAPLLRDNLAHPDDFARMWVARAAGRAGNVDALLALSRDPVPNVRTVALTGLAATLGGGADTELLAALAEENDNQLLLTVAGLLEGTEARAQAAEAALGALGRISRPRWETLRDARVTLLGLLERTGDATLVPRVESYLRDHDPAVAARAAGVLLAWTGKRWIDAPRGSTPLHLPTPDEIRAMATGALVFHMVRGGSFRVRLLPWQAPTNAVRLWRMATEGTLDGLTFHRVVGNFVIQGGSPGANEYAGHGAFTRDEVGLVPNWRGTVGVSTRGRDTGDGQIYVNLVDNVRLDHDYTILGSVTEGMDVVDAVMEGDRIERVEVLLGV